MKNFISLLAVAFIALKLSDHIDWAWWWVLSPLWIGAVVVVVAEFASAHYNHWISGQNTEK